MVGFIVAGLVIGALARVIRPGPQHLSLLMTLLVGVAGSVIGGLLANAVGTGDLLELNVLGFAVALGSSVLVLGILEGAARTKDR